VALAESELRERGRLTEDLVASRPAKPSSARRTRPRCCSLPDLSSRAAIARAQSMSAADGGEVPLRRSRPKIFRQIARSAEFGFCKSHGRRSRSPRIHTASSELYYPAEFYVGLLNNQPMGFHSPAGHCGRREAAWHRDPSGGCERVIRESCRRGASGRRERNVTDSSKTIARERTCRIPMSVSGFDKVRVRRCRGEAIVAERETNGPFRGSTSSHRVWV